MSRSYRSHTVNVSVDVDLDEVLESIDDDDLADALESRGLGHTRVNWEALRMAYITKEPEEFKLYMRGVYETVTKNILP